MPADLTAKRDEQNQLQLSWKPAALLTSIAKLAEDVEKSAVQTSDWYMAKRMPPARGARWTRILAIVFVTIGGLAPLIESTFGGIPGAVTVTGTSAGYLFLALAAACIALDRYAGFSSSWMRRVTTAHAVKRLVIEFRVQWPPLVAEVEAKSTIAVADVKPLFERVAKFATDVEDLVKEETRLWKVEFESAFAQIEKASQAGKAEAAGEKPAEPPPPPPPAPPLVAVEDGKPLTPGQGGAAKLTPPPPAPPPQEPAS
jgi:SMODS and SLOG-associating 2TM effector domain 2